MPDELVTRSVEQHEIAAWSEGEWMAWGYRQGASWRAVVDRCDLVATIDGGELVAGSATTPLELTVPGGFLPVAGVASVWVSPARRGKGLLRSLVESRLADFAGNGVAATVLVASDPGIYHRFGFGVATYTARLRVALERGSRVAPGARTGRLTISDRDAGLEAATSVYDLLRPKVPGMLDRPAAWWEYSYPPSDPDDENPYLFAVHEASGAPDGYAAYSVSEGWTEDGRPDNLLRVHELVAATPGAHTALWEFCLGLDLCSRLEAENRPVDEPLDHLVAAPGAIRRWIADGLHLRILDVPAALAARRYSAADALTLDLRDEAGGWAGGRWLLDGGLDGAECTRTRREADVALDVSALASVYLGGTTFEALRRAGLVEEGRDGAVRRADRLFGWSPAPWLPWDY